MIKFETYPSLEAQISAISDDIAYNNHDLEDGLRANLFNIKSLNSIPLLSSLIKKHLINIKKFKYKFFFILKKINRSIMFY